MMMDVTTMSAGMIVAMGIYRPAIFIFALFGIAAIAALSASAVAQNPQAPINTLTAYAPGDDRVLALGQ